jgi:hypothetical protein
MATAFVMVGPVHSHHLRHSGFAGCPDSGFSRAFLWGSGVDCWSGGLFFDPSRGGFVGYDFPVTGGGLPGTADRPTGILAYGGSDGSLDDAGSAKSATLLALADGSEFALTQYWLEGHELHYITTYGGRNSLPVERIDLDRTVADNAARGIRFVLKPRPAGTSGQPVTP